MSMGSLPNSLSNLMTFFSGEDTHRATSPTSIPEPKLCGQPPSVQIALLTTEAIYIALVAAFVISGMYKGLRARFNHYKIWSALLFGCMCFILASLSICLRRLITSEADQAYLPGYSSYFALFWVFGGYILAYPNRLCSYILSYPYSLYLHIITGIQELYAFIIKCAIFCVVGLVIVGLNTLFNLADRFFNLVHKFLDRVRERHRACSQWLENQLAKRGLKRRIRKTQS